MLSKGISIIKNIAIEPEINELVNMLRSMGAIIFLNKNRKLTIHGIRKLYGTNFFINGDRIEIVSWASLACALNSNIQISGIRPDLIKNFLPYFNKIGGGFKFLKNKNILLFRRNELKFIEIETDIYPGFSTDWQQPFSIILTQTNGISIIHETVYEKRFDYLKQINKLGAITKTVNYCLGYILCRYKNKNSFHATLIRGTIKLKSVLEKLKIPDLRAGLAYIIASILSQNNIKLDKAEEVERGYGNLIKKLKNTNIKIRKNIIKNITKL